MASLIKIDGKPCNARQVSLNITDQGASFVCVLLFTDVTREMITSQAHAVEFEGFHLQCVPLRTEPLVSLIQITYRVDAYMWREYAAPTLPSTPD